jgi:putative alpha-1,2-mannosidase
VGLDVGWIGEMIDAVNPFIGCEASDLDPQIGLAATWWSPKPQVGNTHPGAVAPFGMVSAGAYSGAYPTGYGLYQLSTEGVPTTLRARMEASGFTHFQQSGTGAIRRYYNYVRVTPMVGSLDDLGVSWPLTDEVAEPGYYAATLDARIRCELTVGPRSAVHRYTFPAFDDARVVVDFSQGGLDIEHGRTVPLSAQLRTVSPGVAQGEVVVEGVPLAVHIECDSPEFRQFLWYDRRLMQGSTRLDFDYIRPTTLRPFGLILMGPTMAGQTVELRIGFSLRGVEQAEANLRRDSGAPAVGSAAVLEKADHGWFDARRSATRRAWKSELDAIRVEGASGERREIFATALYHSMIKPCFAADESPFWPDDGSFVFDVSTMWDIYRTQLPLMTALDPDRAVEFATALLTICEQEGNLPIGYRMAKGADRFARQGSALAHTLLADLCELGLDGIDWEWALVHMHSDLRRNSGEEFLERGIVHPISHHLDITYGYHCTAKIARALDDHELAADFDRLAAAWTAAFDDSTGLLVDSRFYEGGKWNYSFRLVADMAARMGLAGGEQRFIELLDAFFGFGADPVKQLGVDPEPAEVEAGYALNRFEGLNNEPDMEAPWAYHYAGRPDRTSEIVHAIVHQQFGLGRGGLPGNDDSGGLSSWYVWASLGLFPVAGQNVFLVNAPSFSRSDIRVGAATFTIDTSGFIEPAADLPPQFVQGVTLNGRTLDRSWISGNELHAGGVLVVDLGNEPSAWASTTRPPSISAPVLAQSPLAEPGVLL